MKTTILYVSSNTQNPVFEKKITDMLLENMGNTPLVSVTQKPMPDMGLNICVGKRKCSYFNQFRQIMIGLNTVTAPYVTIAEADTVYPPEYFQFEPPELGHAYRYDNCWVQDLNPKRNPNFRWKNQGHFAQVVDVELWLKHLNIYFEGKQDWYAGEVIGYCLQLPMVEGCDFTGRPVVSFKTEGGLKAKSPTSTVVEPKESIDYWGSAELLKEKMLSII